MLCHKTRRIALTMLSAAFSLMSSTSHADLNQPLLGRGYDSDKTNATTQNCVVGRLEEAGQSTSLLRFNLEMDKNKFYEKFRMKANGEFTFKFIKGDNTTEFLKEVTDKNLDLNFVYNLSYQAPSLVFIPEGLSETGRLLADNPVGWKTSCGTDYISEHTRGAELFVAFRFRFNDYLSKTKFESSTNISSISDLGKMSLEIEKLSEKYSSSAKIDVVAYQLGGDPTKLGTILGGNSGEMHILDCNFDNIQGCKGAVNNVLQYSSGDFATDANNTPSQVGYRTASYLINGKQYPTTALTSASKTQLDARKKAVEKLNVLEADLVKADQVIRYWQPRLSSAEYSNILSTRDTISYELGLVRSVAFNCFDNPTNCSVEYNKISKLPSYQQSILQTPAPIIRSSETLSTISNGSTNFNILDSCKIPDNGSLLTGIAIESPKEGAFRFGIKLYYRKLNSNGTLGTQAVLACGPSNPTNGRAIVAPFGRVIVGYGAAIGTREILSFEIASVTALQVKSCTIDSLTGKLNLNDCLVSYVGNGPLNSWYEPGIQGDIGPDNSVINSIGFAHYNGSFRMLKTAISYFGEPDISDIRVSFVPTGGGNGNSFIRDSTGKVSYRVITKNNGPDSAENISINSYIPSGVDFFRVTPQQSTCVPVGSNLQCRLDSLESNSEEWIDIELDASAFKKGGFVISSLAASQTNFDPIDTNNVTKEPNAGHGGSLSSYVLLMLGLISAYRRGFFQKTTH